MTFSGIFSEFIDAINNLCKSLNFYVIFNKVKFAIKMKNNESFQVEIQILQVICITE